MRSKVLISLGIIGLALIVASCGDGDSGQRVVRYELTAEVVDWKIVDGEISEVWGYNGQYPGPLLTATVGDLVQVKLTNMLPEGTTIHWHGLEVPNEQDGVPGITQLLIEPGQSYEYEFEVDEARTTMYHTHANTVRQMSRGLLGGFIIRDEPAKQTPKYDRDYTLVLHEIDGLFTINGHSFPETLSDPNSLIEMTTGERILVRMINAGQQHHPMHMHGHQFKVVAIDGSTLETPVFMNTVDVPPGQTVDVEVIGDNPGTWTFHCHILPHVTNRGTYPGGMLTLVDYTDHTSMLEGAAPPQIPQTVFDPAPIEEDEAVASPDTTVVDISATEFAFGPDQLRFQAGEEVTIVLRNDGAVIHNLEIPEFGVFVEAAAGVTEQVTFTVPETASGPLDFWCNIAGHREAGMEGTVLVG